MVPEDPSHESEQELKAAFDAFCEAWSAEKPIDPELFCKDYPRCGPRLRRKIEDYLYVAQGLRGRDPGKDSGPGRQRMIEPEQVLGDFRIIREIGRGGMGEIYEAEQISLNRRVALKLLRPHLRFSSDAVKRFRREAEAGGRQSHPGIVAIHAVGEEEGIHYIAQELIEGSRSLTDWLEEKKKQGDFHPGYFQETAKIIGRVAEALHHAHSRGVIHRDIKPSNILFAENAAIKVTDFGVAKVRDAQALTRSGESAGGTYCYMSPEQAGGKQVKIDHRTDIFSLGVTLYEMLTLVRPFEGRTDQEILKRIQLHEPKDPKKLNSLIPRDLAVICLKAMEKRPEERYETMEAFSRDLGCFQNGEVIAAKPCGMVNKAWKRVRHNPLVSAALGLAVLALIAFVSILAWSLIRDARYFKTIIRLSDGYTLTILNANQERLWSLTGSLIPEMQDWLARADSLVENREEHRFQLETIRARALPYDEAMQRQDYETHPDAKTLRDTKNVCARLKGELDALESQSTTDSAGGNGEPVDFLDSLEVRLQGLRDRITRLTQRIADLEKETSKRRTWRFSNYDDQWWHDILMNLVLGMDDFVDKDKGNYHSVLHRIRFATTVEDVCGNQYKEAWEDAIESIADPEECPIYNGLRITPQPGMVPVGRDPRSDLWEFAHLLTGEVPDRNQKGRLLYGEEHGLVFVLIPGGTYSMGAIRPDADHPVGTPNVDPGCLVWEQPVHSVTVSPFFLSKYEMNQAQWLRITRENPSRYQPGEWFGDKVHTLLHPVERVSWDDCALWLPRMGLRFPSDAEWEYAARAGTTTVRWFGDDRLPGTVNLKDRFYKQYGYTRSSPGYEPEIDDGYARHAPVNSLLPNPFGLHHILGNVNEYCADNWHGNYTGAPDDGTVWTDDEKRQRVIRSCHFLAMFNYCRTAYREFADPELRASVLGIRPALSLDQ